MAKIKKILRQTLWLVVCSVLFLFVLINNTTTQNWILHQVLQKVNQDLNVNIKLHSFDFTLPTSLTLNHLQIPDQHNDTLFYINKVTLPLVQINRQQKVISFGNAKIEKAYIHMGFREGDTSSNYSYLINYLSPPRDPAKEKPPIWHIHFKSININQSEFRYFNASSPASESMDFNPSDMRFSQINGQFKNFKLIGDSIYTECKALSVNESSGITVEHLESVMRISSTTLQFNKLKLQTPNSSLGNFIKFSYANWSDFSDFNHKVFWDIDLANTYLDMADLRPFSYQLGQLEDLKLRLEMNLLGTTNRIKARNVSIKTQNNTDFQGQLHIYGLPEIENSYFNIDIQNLKSKGLEFSQLLGLDNPEYISVAESLGAMHYAGSFKGFYNNFVSFGTLTTQQGQIKTDISLDMSKGLDHAIYSGMLQTDQLNLGTLLQNKSLGKVSLNLQIDEGVGLSSDNFSFQVQGQIPQLRFDRYTYTNTQIFGQLTEHYFKGKAVVKDAHIELDFNGLIDLREGREESDFNLNLKKLHLNKLGYDTLPGNIAGEITIKTKGRSLDEITGIMETQNLRIERGDHHIELDKLSLLSELRSGERFFELNSTPLDLTLQGDFSLEGLPNTLSYIGGELLPGILPGTQKLKNIESLTFNINLKNTTPIIRLFNEHIDIGTGFVKGGLNSEFLSLSLNSELEYFHLSGLEFINTKLIAHKNAEEELNVQYSSSLQLSNSKFKTDSLNLKAKLKAGRLQFNLNAADQKNDIFIGVNGGLQFGDTQGVKLHLADMGINLKGKEWVMLNPSNWNLLPKLSSDPLQLISGSEEVLFFSNYNSELSRNELEVRLTEFDVSQINTFMPQNTPLFSGIAEGFMTIKSGSNHLGIQSNMLIKSMAIERDTVGDLRLKTESLKPFSTQVSATVKTGIFNGLKLFGTMGAENNPQHLNLKLHFPKTEVAIFSHFLSGISNLNGKASGDILITGTLYDPQFNGGMSLSEVGLTIDYLRVPFNINANIKVDSNEIKIGKESRITDDKKKTASLSGWLKHTKFSDWQYHISIEGMRDFHVLNTAKSDNDLFYGQAYVDGSGSFFGSFDKFNMKLKAKTKSGTLIKMPIGESEASGPAPYIRFKSEKPETEIQQVDIGFLNSLLMEVEITPATEVQLIFDEQTGDIIKGSGTGKLVMEVSEDGNFTMRGGLTVERGDYQFVAFNNLVNKRFFIERGGTIMWDGDPLLARINLTTYNLQMTSPNPLLGRSGNTTPASGGQILNTVQARSEIHLRGSLFRPEISFGIDIQNLLETGMSELSGVVQRIQNDPDEVNRQVFSLLVFGSFVVPSFINIQDAGDLNQSAPLSTGLADLVTNQVDAWLSQIDPKWLVDFNLTSTTPDQRSDMIFRLGRKFANDRIIVDIIYGTNQAGPANNSFNMEYLATRDGRFRLKAFSRTAAIYNNANAIAPVNTIGIGVFYRKEFNRFFPATDSNYIILESDSNTQILNLQDSLLKSEPDSLQGNEPDLSALNQLEFFENIPDPLGTESSNEIYYVLLFTFCQNRRFNQNKKSSQQSSLT